jgi:hypothetical protein
MQAEDQAARLYETVADDEALRGSLTDDGYGAILTWVDNRATYLVAEGRGVDFDTLARTLRAAVHALVRAAETDNPTELTGIDPLVASPAAVAAITAALVTAPDEPDARARAMAMAPIDGLGT